MTAGPGESRHVRSDRAERSGGGVRLLLVLAGLSAASPLATDMYVPGLPEMARSLQTDSAGAQVSLTGFLAGIIVGQFVLGPLSDGVGRRPVLLGGTSLFAAFSVLCGFAPAAVVLDVARVGQGIAGAAGIVVARAVITDLFSGVRLAKKIGALGAVTALGPVAAPMLGGAILAVASWRVVFFGVFFPAVTTVAQSRGRDAPGATSALLGSSQFALGAVVSPVVGLFGAHSPAPIAAVMTVCLAAAVTASLPGLVRTGADGRSTASGEPTAPGRAWRVTQGGRGAWRSR